jgi:CBS domain containing-hemolysin-like protein
MWIPVVLGVLAVALGATLTAYAAALVSVEREALQTRCAAGHRSAGIALGALDHAAAEVTRVRLWVVFAAVATGALLAAWSFPATGDGTVVRGWAAALSFVLVAGLQIVLGRMVAASIGAQRPLPTLRVVALPAALMSRLISPLAVLGDAVGHRVARAFAVGESESRIGDRSTEELRRLVQRSQRSGAIRAADAELFDRTLRFGDKRAADAFTPRVEMVSLPAEATVSELVERSGITGYSRFPVHEGDLDHVLGVVHVKDVLGVPPQERAVRPVSALVRPVHVVPESKDLGSLMRELRGATGQFALVVDEYGGTAGIITLEDLLEEIVGEIADEHDPAQAVPMVRRWGGAHLLGGSLHLDEVEDACGFRIPAGEYETLGGFVMSELGRVPSTGERFDFAGWEVEVEEMDGHRIRTVKLLAPSPGTLSDPDGERGPR